MLHKVKRILTDAELAEFNELAADERQTGDMLHAWMVERGYSICRSAVYRYRQSLVRQQDVGELCQALAGYSDNELRRKIGEAIQTLKGRDLGIIALMAGGMAGTLQNHVQDGVGDGSKAD